MYWVSVLWECWFMKTISVWCHDKKGNLITNSHNVIVRSIENLMNYNKKIPPILVMKKLGCYTTIHMNNGEPLFLGWTRPKCLGQVRPSFSLSRVCWTDIDLTPVLGRFGATLFGQPRPSFLFGPTSAQFLLGWISTQPRWAQPIYLG